MPLIVSTKYVTTKPVKRAMIISRRVGLKICCTSATRMPIVADDDDGGQDLVVDEFRRVQLRRMQEPPMPNWVRPVDSSRIDHADQHDRGEDRREARRSCGPWPMCRGCRRPGASGRSRGWPRCHPARRVGTITPARPGVHVQQQFLQVQEVPRRLGRVRRLVRVGVRGQRRVEEHRQRPSAAAGRPWRRPPRPRPAMARPSPRLRRGRSAAPGRGHAPARAAFAVSPRRSRRRRSARHLLGDVSHQSSA